MRSLLISAAAGLILFGAAPAFADDSLQNLSTVVEQSGKTTALLAESGLKATVGVLAAPIGLAGSAAGVVGSAAVTVADGSLASGEALGHGAEGGLRFAREPLKVDNDIVVAPQPAPKVPYNPQAPRPQETRR